MDIESVSLDEIIKARKQNNASLSSSSGSGGAALRNSSILGHPKAPLPYDWTWVAGEEPKKRVIPSLPRGFKWKFGQTFNRSRFLRMSNSRLGGVYRGPYENPIPVHLRLGFMTPARRYALGRLKNALSVNRRKQTHRARPYPNTGFHRQRIEDDDETAEPLITVSFRNELAMAPPPKVPRFKPRTPRTPQNGPRLSRQNVAQLGSDPFRQARNGSQVSASHGSWATIQSWNQSYYKSQRKILNRRLWAQRQLPSTPHAMSLTAVHRCLRSEMPEATPKTHVAALDKQLQEQINQIQRMANNVKSGNEDYNYRAPTCTTTTSTSDRFSLMV